MSIRIALYIFIFFILNPNITFGLGKKGNLYQADALNLLIKKVYTVKQNGGYKLRLYLKTKIITYKGKKDLSDFKIHYNSAFENIKVIYAKTITKEGKEVQVSKKEIQDISDPSTQRASIFASSRYKIINFPSVEEGCTIELEVEKNSKIGFWGAESFHLLNPTKEKRVVILVPQGSNLKFYLKSSKITLEKNREGNFVKFLWVGKNLEKIPNEPFMPPYFNRSDTLIFSLFNSWQEVSSFFRKKLKLDNTRLNISHLSEPIKKLIRQKDVFGVYTFLQDNFGIYNLPFFLSNLKTRPIETVLSNRFGTQTELTLCFYSLLKKMGYKPEIVAVSSSGTLLKDLKEIPSPSFFSTFIIKTKKGVFSFNNKELPPGITGFDGQFGLSLSSGNFVTIKDRVKSATYTRYEYFLKDPSFFNVIFQQKESGLNVIRVKKLFKHLTKKEFEVRESIFLHSLHPLSKPTSNLKIKGLSDNSTQVEMSIKYAVKNFLIKNNSLYILPLPTLQMLKTFSRLPRERKTPLFINRNVSYKLDVIINLPKNLRLIAMPKNTYGKIGPLYWHSWCKRKENKIFCQKELTLTRWIIRDPKNFLKFRNVALTLIAPSQSSIFYTDQEHFKVN